MPKRADPLTPPAVANAKSKDKPYKLPDDRCFPNQAWLTREARRTLRCSAQRRAAPLFCGVAFSLAGNVGHKNQWTPWLRHSCYGRQDD